MVRSPERSISRSADHFPRLYAIIDRAQTAGCSPLEVAEALLSAGIRLIQLRDKDASSRSLYESAQPLAERVHQNQGRFIVNDRADIALAVDADGVHLGQDDLPVEQARGILSPGRWVGYSTHDLEQVREADHSSADYIAFGPVFATESKRDHEPVVGLQGLRLARQATRKPLVAIGGITLANVRSVMQTGADCVALIRGLIGTEDISRRAEQFVSLLSDIGESSEL